MRGAERVFWSAVGIGAAAYFIVAELHIPVLGPLLGWGALAWAGYWFVDTGRPRTMGWLWAAVVGACAAVAGSLVGMALSLVVGILHPFSLPLAALGLLGSLLGVLFYAVPVGAICGAIGGLLAGRRPGRRPWRRWDPDA